MDLNKAKQAADDLQRGQAVWTVISGAWSWLPEPIRGWIKTGLWAIAIAVGTWIAGKASRMSPYQIYVSMVATVLIVCVAYAGIRAQRSTERGKSGIEDAAASPSITVEHYGGNDAT